MSAAQLAALVAHEQQLFIQAHPRSQSLAQQSAQHFAHGVPLHWMRDWGTPFPPVRN
jgi:glutamate-1-semialdehyde 2,1-aminomutase